MWFSRNIVEYPLRSSNTVLFFWLGLGGFGIFSTDIYILKCKVLFQVASKKDLKLHINSVIYHDIYYIVYFDLQQYSTKHSKNIKTNEKSFCITAIIKPNKVTSKNAFLMPRASLVPSRLKNLRRECDKKVEESMHDLQ